MWKQNVICVGIVVACIGLVASIEYATTAPPRDRDIHLEAFRYGVEPSVLRVNRGDHVSLTFSSRDTAHSFFLQDYRIDAKILPEGGDTIEVFDPLRATDPPIKVRKVEFDAGLPGWLGQFITVSRHRCHVYCGPMHGFEQGDMIVRPNWLFATAIGLMMAIPLVGIYRIRTATPHATVDPPPVDLMARPGWLKAVIHWRPLQFTVTLPVLAFFVLVIVAGIFGTKVGGRNIAVIATWVIWMFVVAALLMPFNSRIWCLLCPLPIIGDYVQRGATVSVRPARTDATAGQPGNSSAAGGTVESKPPLVGNAYLGLGWRWPKMLRGSWLRQLMFLCIGTLAASFAGMPKWTAILLLSMGVAATLLAIFWERRAFCQYLCPVTSFLSIYGGVGRMMVRARERDVCRKCREKSCYRGNADGWACPFNVFTGSLKDNAECGCCTECFKSCPYDNVTVAWRRGPMREEFKTVGQAWQVLAMLTLGMAYSLVILSPWPAMRDIVNIVDKGHWPLFFAYVVVLWSTTLFVVPGLYWLATRWGMRRAGIEMPWRRAFKRFAPTFVPLGAGLWIAFFTTMMMANYTFVLMTLSDPFGWGWDWLGTSGRPWVQLWPGAVPWMQTALLLGGLALSLRKGYGLWLVETNDSSVALKGFVPMAGLLLMLATGMALYFTCF
jgi:polyferredoxin